MLEVKTGLLNFCRPDRVGEALIEIIKKGKNGSFWVVEEDEPAYEIVVPCYRTMKV